MIKYFLCFVSLWLSLGCFGQEDPKVSVLTFSDYINHVKEYHPILKQAQLQIQEGQVKELKARGGFDPKLEVDYKRKEFKKSSYYGKLNAALKIPTWYGIDFKASYENNTGKYLNPELNTPGNGLYAAGVSVNLAKSFLMSNRMATLKQAKLYTTLSQSKQRLLINDLLFEASEAYFNWLNSYQKVQIYTQYEQNARVRFQNVKTSFEKGDKPAIDTLEAHVNLDSRRLDLEKVKIERQNNSLLLSNFLWSVDNQPFELNQGVIPDVGTLQKVDLVLNASKRAFNTKSLDEHPKIKSLQLKREMLNVDRRLKRNSLLPSVNLNYNFLTAQPSDFQMLTPRNYKAEVGVDFPLFMRKQRADLQLTKLKIQDVDFELNYTKQQLQNKVSAVEQKIASYQQQLIIANSLVGQYEQLVDAENRIFNLGEGTLFLVNYREVKWIEAAIKNAEVEFNLLNSKAELLQITSQLY